MAADMMALNNIQWLRDKYRSDNYIAFTVDIDWASEDCIADILDFFALHQAPLNIFCTHPSAVLQERGRNPLIELGIHPNYSGQSSQGATMDEVTDYCMQLVPGARSVRGHRWFSSNDMYDRLLEKGILYDSNECSMLDLVEPYIHRSGMLRFPVFFEDGGFLWGGIAPDFAANGKTHFSQPGLKVLDLHPIHFAVNSPDLQYYRAICDTLSREEYATLRRDQIIQMRYGGKGMRSYMMELMDFIQAKGVQVVALWQVYDAFRGREGGESYAV